MKITEKYGEWAFLMGVILAVVIGLFSGQLGENVVYVYAALLVLGFVVGFLNIEEKRTERRTDSFLIAVITLLVATTWGPALSEVLFSIFGEPGLTFSGWINSFLIALQAFISPAAFVVALKAVYDLASRK